MQNNARCPLCQSEYLTPRTKVSAGHQDPHLLYSSPGGGVFAVGVALKIEGVACLNCGHVVLFLSDRALAEARTHTAWKPVRD